MMTIYIVILCFNIWGHIGREKREADTDKTKYNALLFSNRAIWFFNVIMAFV